MVNMQSIFLLKMIQLIMTSKRLMVRLEKEFEKKNTFAMYLY